MAESRSYSLLTIKKLFALSRNVCAFPGCDIRFCDPAWESVLADITHIEGLNPGSARHNPALTTAEANSFDNLMLMCKNHNWHIDRMEPSAWSVERLRELKASHESGRAGDSRPDPSLQDQFVVQIAVAMGIKLDPGDGMDIPDSAEDVEILDPAIGMRIMTSAVADLEVLERQLGIGPPERHEPIDDGWISYGIAAKDRFERAVTAADKLPYDQPTVTLRSDLIRLQAQAMDAFNRIPAN